MQMTGGGSGPRNLRQTSILKNGQLRMSNPHSHSPLKFHLCASIHSTSYIGLLVSQRYNGGRGPTLQLGIGWGTTKTRANKPPMLKYEPILKASTIPPHKEPRSPNPASTVKHRSLSCQSPNSSLETGSALSTQYSKISIFRGIRCASPSALQGPGTWNAE